tara:strand:- start:3256 stop:3363 length:108 start_codon:yes stop_codon:yes gene_type:complete
MENAFEIINQRLERIENLLDSINVLLIKYFKKALE